MKMSAYAENPKAGLMEKIKEHYNISLKKVPAVGDSARDLEAY